MTSDKSYIPCIKQNKLLKSIKQYNEFNKGIIQKWILYLWSSQIITQSYR